MNKIEFMRLWDLYGGLLTDTQQEITSMYFNLDLTVSEIAEQKGISRQAISECLANCKKQLEECEEKLHISYQNVKYSLQVSFMMT
ncbi:MAG: sigma factor-like helix-turn-helix DNA-binding protein, partial [Candidatus Coproplasma sp.]